MCNGCFGVGLFAEVLVAVRSRDLGMMYCIARALEVAADRSFYSMVCAGYEQPKAKSSAMPA